jgi:hypothetical protein
VVQTSNDIKSTEQFCNRQYTLQSSKKFIELPSIKIRQEYTNVVLEQHIAVERISEAGVKLITADAKVVEDDE